MKVFAAKQNNPEASIRELAKRSGIAKSVISRLLAVPIAVGKGAG
jgi:hypothetical protein